MTGGQNLHFFQTGLERGELKLNVFYSYQECLHMYFFTLKAPVATAADDIR